MNIIRKYAKSAVAAIGATAAVPAMLFAGAGLAQAGTVVATTTDGAGVTVNISSNSIAGWDFSTLEELCRYTAVPKPGTTPAQFLPPLPVYDVPFPLQKGGTHSLWFPGIQTTTEWNVTITCPVGGESTHQVTY